MINRRILYAFILLCNFFKLLPQQLNVAHYSTSDGLSNSCIYGLHQDKQGFLWIATEFGLNKFDGNEFKSYDVSNDFPENITLSVTSGLNDEVQIGTFSKGIITIYPDGKIKSLIDPFNGGQITKVFQADSVLYSFSLGSNNAMAYNLLSHKTMVFESKPTNNNRINAGCLVDGRFLLATTTGLYTLSEHNKKLVCSNLYCKNINAMCTDVDGNIWIGLKGVIYKIDPHNYQIRDSVVFDHTRQNKVHRLMLDSKNKVWFSTLLPVGLRCATKTGNTYAIDNISEKLNIGYTDINDFLLDRESNVWIATYNKGIYCIRNTFLYSDEEYKGLFFNTVFVDNKGIRYLAGIKGTCIIDPVKKKSFVISADKNLREYTYGYQQFDDEIFTKTNGAYKNAKPYYNKENHLYILETRSIFFVNDALALFGGWFNEVTLKLYKHKKFTDLYAIALEKNNKHTNRVHKITKDQNGNIWCGADLGLYKIDLNKRESIKMVDKSVSLKITDIVASSKDALWFAGENSLIKYNGNAWESFTDIDGYKLGKVNSLALDKKNRLYVATYKGLFIIDNGFNSFLNDKSGLPSNEINCLAYDSINNIMAFVTNEGYTELMIDEYDNFKKLPLKLIMKSVSVGDSVFPLKNKYVINYKQNNISLNYVAINLTYPKSVIYQYQIDRAGWVKTSLNTIELASLGYGEHDIKIRASLDSKNWCSPASISIMVIAPFYATKRFRIIVLVALILIGYLFTQFRIRRIRKKAAEKMTFQKQLEDLKFKSLNASINPHFIFNSLNSVQSYINHNNKNEASNYLAKFARLIRLVLNKANEKEITVKEEIERLTYYIQLEQDRFTQNFTFNIDAPVELYDVAIPNMIIQPLIENAILHGIKHIKKAHIDISFIKEGQSLIIKVEDNGVGIGSENKIKSGAFDHKSMAINNIHERLSLYPNASLLIINKKTLNPPGQGTLAKITLKI